MSFAQRIRPRVRHELQAAAAADRAGHQDAAFRHLERAHVLGQASTVEHVRAHVHMLLWALRHRRARETWGQLMRIVGAATKTVFWIPVGNTGGADISPFRRLPVAPDLAQAIRDARTADAPRESKR
ncbi:DUF3703 domain-containing protein [Piscinibacter gummiphilus]|uniref:DUF3703 domain-containing protein n=1 Tax=Piscinibacter gummiphilus TaxID=946333 RepID=A0ABZ0CTS5_9BURK|nr:DUF3703 domain-containing protein [Piscinibacter gummiphilus]WOB05939.1 DUF3703 domain-containing protein [Piscinibacter gummiphilus]